MLKIIREITIFKSLECPGTKLIVRRALASITTSNSMDDTDKAIDTQHTVKTSLNYDIVIVGGGIVGVATARELSNRHCNLRIALLEKEKNLAAHQSGHNSGVVHAGIYYTPGSLKAKLCVEGLQLSYKYFNCKNIPYKKIGKLIVATNKCEVTRLKDLYERGIQNSVPGLQYLKSEKEIKEKEPLCTGLEALWSPETGIVDWGLVTHHYAKDFEKRRGEIHSNFQVSEFCESGDPNYPIKITSLCNKAVQTKYVLTCAGLYSDHLAVMSGCSKHPKIVPFRGEYLLLKPEKACQFKTNIYPVPDPGFPFLGVHVTPRMDGNVWLGPNAVLAFKREGYRWSDINFRELLETVFYPGFIRLSLKYLIPGTKEMIKSLFVSMQLKDVQKFVPSIGFNDIQPGVKVAGVRAQALDPKGNLVDDFIFHRNSESDTISSRILHCRNAPSPGATSSLSIAKMVADRCEAEFKLKELIK